MCTPPEFFSSQETHRHNVTYLELARLLSNNIEANRRAHNEDLEQLVELNRTCNARLTIAEDNLRDIRNVQRNHESRIHQNEDAIVEVRNEMAAMREDMRRIPAFVVENRLPSLRGLPLPGQDGYSTREESFLFGKKVVVSNGFNSDRSRSEIVSLVEDFGGTALKKFSKGTSEYLRMFDCSFISRNYLKLTCPCYDTSTTTNLSKIIFLPEQQRRRNSKTPKKETLKSSLL